MNIEGHGAQRTVRYSQGMDLPQMNLDSSTRGGVCAAISAYWLAHRAEGADFWQWIRSVRGKVTVINSQATGEINRKHTGFKVPGLMKHDTTGNPNAWIASLLKRRANLTQNERERTTARFMQASDWILHSKGGLVFIGLYGPAGGHAVAADTRDGVTFMDPNVGEVTFPAPGNFMVWLPSFVGSYQFRDTPTSPPKGFTRIGCFSFS